MAPKRTLLVVGGAAGLLLLALAAPLVMDVNRYKPRLESAISDAVGMNVHIAGRLRIGLLPRFQLTMDDVQALDDQGKLVASAKRVRLGVEPLPLLLRREFRLRRVELVQPNLSLDRNTRNAESVPAAPSPLQKVAALLATMDHANVSVTDGTLRYADSTSGRAFEAVGCSMNGRTARPAGGSGAEALKSLSLEAKLSCREFRTRGSVASAVKADLDAKNGVVDLRIVSLHMFGGEAKGSVRADLTGATPQCQVHFSLPSFRIEQFLATLSSKPAARGAMSFSANLSMQGETVDQLERSASGRLSLRGHGLTLVGNDVDGQMSKLQSNQNFSLADVGGVFVAGPMGLAVTRGLNVAGLLRGTGGRSDIVTLVSDWKVEHGVAEAEDVAMATTKNRIALHGGLDFADNRFANVTVAVVDEHGCARVTQAIHGSFANPTTDKPNVLTSVSGPIVNIFRQVKRLIPSGPCEAFYTGSVQAP